MNAPNSITYAMRTARATRRARELSKSRGLVRDGDRRGAVTAFQFVSAHQAIYGIASMCRVLAVSASGYYAWRQRPPSARVRADAELTTRIRAIHQYSRGTYGAPRIHQELMAADIHAACKRVARLMKAAGLKGASRRQSVVTTVRDRNARPAPDLVERNFVAPAPNCWWVADITHIPTAGDTPLAKERIGFRLGNMYFLQFRRYQPPLLLYPATS
jgi:HTH-like domain